MANYVLRVQISNPVTGGVRELTRLFDPATITATKWQGLGQVVQALVQDLVADAAGGSAGEPPPL